MRMINIKQADKRDSVIYKNKEIDRWIESLPGTIVMRDSYKSLKDLEDDWRKFNDMPYEYKMLSNDKSIQLFGFQNEDRYNKMRAQFLQQDIPHKDIIKDRLYLVTDLQEDTIELFSNQDRMHGYLESIRETDDIVQSIIFYQNSKELVLEGDVISNSILDLEHKTIEKRLHETIDPRFNMGLYTPQLLPEEIEDYLGKVVNEQEWFINYKAKRYGLAPTMEGFYRYHHQAVNGLLNSLDNDPSNEEAKTTLLELGCYPFRFKTKGTKRVNDLIKEEVSNFKFIDLTNMPKRSLTEETDYSVIKGITIYNIDGDIRDDYKFDTNIPNTFVSFDISSNNVIPIIHGDLEATGLLDEYIEKYSNDSIMNVMFLPLEADILEKIKQVAYSIQRHVITPQNNFLRNICDQMRLDVPRIGNFKLYYYYLMNMILNCDCGETKDIDFDNNKIKHKIVYNYELYSGRLSDFNKSDVFSKLQTLTNVSSIIGKVVDNMTESFVPYVKIQSLREYAEIPVEFDKDGNIFIKKKENIDFAAEYKACHRLLVQYDKVHNYDALKYYTAKLWYMNILIEKILYSEKNKEKYREQLPKLYNTRAHILSDFNIYMAKILEHEPEFDFIAYYKTTPFDRSVLKISRNFLTRIWDYVTNILKLLSL